MVVLLNGRTAFFHFLFHFTFYHDPLSILTNYQEIVIIKYFSLFFFWIHVTQKAIYQFQIFFFKKIKGHFIFNFKL